MTSLEKPLKALFFSQLVDFIKRERELLNMLLLEKILELSFTIFY
jgi:hypothetical protein